MSDKPIEYHPLIKARYTRREPKPGGGYRYFYDEPGSGPQQGGKKPATKIPVPKSGKIDPIKMWDTLQRPGKAEEVAGIIEMVRHAGGDARRVARELVENSHPMMGAAFVMAKESKVLRSHLEDTLDLKPGALDDLFPTHARLTPDVVGAVASPTRKSMSNINPLDLIKGNIHMSELDGLTPLRKAAGDDEVEEAEEDEDEEEEDPAEAEAKKEEEAEKSMSGNPLDLVKATAPEPRAFRQGSVIYANPPAYNDGPMGSRPDLGRPARPTYEKAERDEADPLSLVRTRDGTLTHPTGVRRRDDDA